MKLKAIYFSADSYVTVRGEHVKHLQSSPHVSLDLDIPTLSVRVDDRNNNGEGVYHVPLACLRRWVPVDVAYVTQPKKAANQ